MMNDIWTRRLHTRDRNCRWLDERFYDLDLYSMYLGDEMNTHHFDWDGAIGDGSIDDTFRIVLMNLQAAKEALTAPAILLFYEELYEYNPDWVVERSFCPPTENNRDLMKTDQIRPFSLEGKMPLGSFDAICLSMDVNGTEVSIPWLLMESRIPLYAKDRTEDDPILILGGAALTNPGPIQDFTDILFFGEGEEVLPKLLEMLEQGKKKGLSRSERLLQAAQTWDCLFVPQFYEERYDAAGKFAGTFPLREGIPEKIRYYRVQDLDRTYVATKPYLNYCSNLTFVSIQEISKGCEGKCSFCMGGFLTLPFRPRSAELVKKNMETLLFETGLNSAALVSYNAVSHPQINRIIRDVSESVGDNIASLTQRLDTYRTNPEYCCFLSVQKSNRAVFGVEGASQRLRDVISKNLHEDQILEAMREISRNGSTRVKFMLISNLPGESREDLEELYQLAVKIRQIFIEEAAGDHKIPSLLFTWTPLVVLPHTPMQWSKVTTEMPAYYEEFTQKITEMGFRTYTPVITEEHIISQLFQRGDGRLSALVADMAEKGRLKFSNGFGEDSLGYVIRFLEDHSLPGLDEWFREYHFEEPFPWEIVEGPASKEYLYQRYLEMFREDPENYPVCTTKCTGCGACRAREQKKLREYAGAREQDARISLRSLQKKKPVPKQYVLMKFGYARKYSFVHYTYWDAEIRRALNKAGISYDPDSIRSIKGYKALTIPASGPNLTCIALTEQYDLQMLRERIQEHAIHFHVIELSEWDRIHNLKTVTYKMKLPEDYDRNALERKLRQSDWTVDIYFERPEFHSTWDVRQSVSSVEISGDSLLVTLLSDNNDPRNVYRFLFDLDRNTRIRQLPERVGFEFD